MKYSTEQIEQLANKLREMPAVEGSKQHSKQEAVRMLMKEITSLQKRGYTIEQVAEALRGGGMDITTPVLKNYLQRAAKTKKVPQGRKLTHPPRPAAPSNTVTAEPAASTAASKATFTPKPDSDEI